MAVKCVTETSNTLTTWTQSTSQAKIIIQPFQGSRVRLIWAHMRREFGVVRPNILFGRTGATENVSGIIIVIFFTEQSIHNIVITTEEAVNEVLIRQRFIRHLINRWNTQDR